MRARERVGIAVAALLAAAGLALPSGPAAAASGYCAGSGVNVVVDFGNLGGVTKACGQGSTAAAVFKSAGFTLRGTPRMSGDFVCTVNGRPTDGQCTATDAYWALFLSTASGGWKYASLGAGSQPVQDGQTVAFAWQHTSGKSLPRATPAVSAQAPTATPSRAASKDRKGDKGRADTSSSTAPTPTPTASPSSQTSPSPSASAKKKRHHAAAATGASPSPSADAGTAYSSTLAADKDDDSGGGLPWWVPAGIVVLLGAGGGTVAWRRSHAGKVS